MQTFLTSLITGLLVGGVYALLGLSLVIIYKSTGVFNFAVGPIVMFGAIVTWALLVQVSLPLWLSLILALVFMAFLGFIIERFAMRPLVGQPVLAMIMVTLGMLYLINGLVDLIWRPVFRVYPEFTVATGVNLGIVVISQQHILAFVIAMIAFGIFVYLFQRTRTGLEMRAVAEDHQLAQSTGINVNRVFMASWMLACVICLIAGILLGTINGVGPGLSELGLKGFPVVLFGGLDSILGCIVGGATIGILENLGATYINPLVGGGVKEIAPFIVLILVLIFKPHGIFGLERIERI